MSFPKYNRTNSPKKRGYSMGSKRAPSREEPRVTGYSSRGRTAERSYSRARGDSRRYSKNRDDSQERGFSRDREGPRDSGRFSGRDSKESGRPSGRGYSQGRTGSQGRYARDSGSGFSRDSRRPDRGYAKDSNRPSDRGRSHREDARGNSYSRDHGFFKNRERYEARQYSSSNGRQETTEREYSEREENSEREYPKKWITCPQCHGESSDKDLIPCPQCLGKGEIPKLVKVTCKVCRGKVRFPCKKCHGRGRINTGFETPVNGKKGSSAAKPGMQNSPASSNHASHGMNNASNPDKAGHETENPSNSNNQLYGSENPDFVDKNPGVVCPKCFGKKYVVRHCKACNSTGTFTKKTGTYVACPTCHKFGTIWRKGYFCDMCQSSGRILD